MWLLYAVNYDKGGRMDLPQSGGALGGCADITALPLLQGVPKRHLSGSGVPPESALDACHLMLGVPEHPGGASINTSWTWPSHRYAQKRPTGGK